MLRGHHHIRGALDAALCMATQIVAARELKDGQQIYNCYGELSNTELVLKYGFALLNNPFSTVELNKAVLVEAAREQLGAEAFSRRQRFLLENRSVSTLGCDESPGEALEGPWNRTYARTFVFAYLWVRDFVPHQERGEF